MTRASPRARAGLGLPDLTAAHANPARPDREGGGHFRNLLSPIPSSRLRDKRETARFSPKGEARASVRILGVRGCVLAPPRHISGVPTQPNETSSADFQSIE